MDHYFVDYENTHADGFRGIDTLEPGAYEVYLFVGRESINLPINICRVLMNKPNVSRLYQAQKTAKNYLDFQLSSFLGFVLGQKLAFKDPEEENGEQDRYIIISHDTGYDSVVDYWTEFIRDNRINANVVFLRQNSIVPAPEEEADREKRPARSTDRRRGRYGRGRNRSAVIAAEETAVHEEKPAEAPSEVTEMPAEPEAAEAEVPVISAEETAAPAEPETPAEEKKDSRRGGRNRGRRGRGQGRSRGEKAAAEEIPAAQDLSQAEELLVEAALQEELGEEAVVIEEVSVEAQPVEAISEETAEEVMTEEAPAAEEEAETENGIPGFKAVTVASGPAVASGIIPDSYFSDSVIFRSEEAQVELVELTEEQIARMEEAAKQEEIVEEPSREKLEEDIEQSQAVELPAPAEVLPEKTEEASEMLEAEEKPEEAASEEISREKKEKPALKKLSNSYRDKIKTAIKDEKVNFRSYAAIYRAVANSRDKAELNNALCKTFKNAQGGRLYNLIKDIFKEYQAAQN